MDAFETVDAFEFNSPMGGRFRPKWTLRVSVVTGGKMSGAVCIYGILGDVLGGVLGSVLGVCPKMSSGDGAGILGGPR